jgi:endonuclease/exonuclease/phosphatase family metal-dependent hydrolase
MHGRATTKSEGEADASSPRSASLCPMKRTTLVLLAWLPALACGGEDTTQVVDDSDGGPSSSSSSSSSSGSSGRDAASPSGDSSVATRRGTFSVLTYNVAGLPSPIGKFPKSNTDLISPKLNAYDLVGVQEDFANHDRLISQLTLPSKTDHKGNGTILNMGDGLGVFSKFAFSGAIEREKWKDCNGLVSDKNDCGADKGFLKISIELMPGIVVDIYDAHWDAGRDSKDVEARDKQTAQMLTKLATTPADHALIVMGDTNMKDEDEPSVQKLLTGANLSDACRKLNCGQNGRLDRVTSRDGTALKLIAKEWKVETTFVDGAGKELSDHEPVKVVFDWEAR